VTILIFVMSLNFCGPASTCGEHVVTKPD